MRVTAKVLVLAAAGLLGACSGAGGSTVYTGTQESRMRPPSTINAGVANVLMQALFTNWR